MAFIAKKVSKMNGDARVAFDLIKSGFVEIFNAVKYGSGVEEMKGDEGMPEDDRIRISFDLIIKVFKDKYSSKLPETLKCLPR